MFIHRLIVVKFPSIWLMMVTFYTAAFKKCFVLVWDYVSSLNIPDLQDILPPETEEVRSIRVINTDQYELFCLEIWTWMQILSIPHHMKGCGLIIYKYFKLGLLKQVF